MALIIIVDEHLGSAVTGHSTSDRKGGIVSIDDDRPHSHAQLIKNRIHNKPPANLPWLPGLRSDQRTQNQPLLIA